MWFGTASKWKISRLRYYCIEARKIILIDIVNMLIFPKVYVTKKAYQT